MVVDFDGSLAAIVDDPATARPLAEATEALARLAARMGRVAVVSGRPVDFLLEVLPGEGLLLVGQYGLERAEGGRAVPNPEASAYAEVVAAAARAAEEAMPSLVVERKGAIAVTLHWRVDPTLEEEALALGHRLAADHGLTAQPGRRALELRPPLPVDKGTAAESLVSGYHAALVAGDDEGDVAAFAALDRLLAGGRLAHGLRIAVRSPEAPARLLDQADYQVDGPEGLADLLTRLADALD